jgi:hypothetical protein
VSKTALIAAIAGCVLAVGAFAALTATVIADDESGGTRVVRLQSAPVPGPGTQQFPGPGHGLRPFGPGQMPGMGRGFGQRLPQLRTCLQQHNALPDGTQPDPQKMRDAMKACMTGKPSIR